MANNRRKRPQLAGTAQSFLTTAALHAKSAQVLRDNGHDDSGSGPLSVSMWFLMGWAVELALKAAILKLGGTLGDCKDLGHDLDAALAAANARGYVTKLINVPNLVHDLNVTHLSHYFRYMPEEDTEVPADSKLAFNVLREMLLEINALP